MLRVVSTLLLVLAAGVVVPSTAPAGAATAAVATGDGTTTTTTTTPVQRQVTAAPPFGGPGTQVAVTGVGWPGGKAISVSLCGNLFLNGSSDCAPSASNTTTTRPDGTFFTEIVVAIPPSPCPCVIHVSGPDFDETTDQPFEVYGAQTATPNRTVARRTVSTTTSLTGTGPLLAYFGGDAKRDYTLTVENTGTVPLLDPPVTVAVGEGEDPTTIVSRPELGEIAPGESATVTVPITIDGPTFGEYTVKATIGGIDETLSVTSTTSSYPWGLFVVGWLALQIPLLGLYRRRRLDAPDDPLDRQFASLLLPTPDYGVESVRDFVEPRSVVVPEDRAPATVIVSSTRRANGQAPKRRAGRTERTEVGAGR